MFDDGYERVHHHVLPLMDRYSLPGVFAVPLAGERIETSEGWEVTSWQQWLKAAEYGHEIAAHSISHRNLTSLTDDELRQELQQPAVMLKATTLVYPGGACDERVIQYARQYYSAGRTVVRGLETIPPKDPMRLQSFNFSKRNFTVTKANLLAVWACVTNNWLIETYHMVDDEEREMVHSTKARDVERHVAFVARLPIEVKTIRQVITGV
ncbi:MAG: polysaccharide deacetylase family protein [Acidobacteriota bacterium]